MFFLQNIQEIHGYLDEYVQIVYLHQYSITMLTFNTNTKRHYFNKLKVP